MTHSSHQEMLAHPKIKTSVDLEYHSLCSNHPITMLMMMLMEIYPHVIVDSQCNIVLGLLS